jgi:uncharacterized protein (TIGR03435 family)
VTVKHILLALGCLLVTLVTICAADQQNVSAGPTFDVASVKKSAPPGTGPTMIVTGALRGDSWNTTNATLRQIIRGAYGTQYQMQGQIIGGPGWLDTDRFDIVAKVGGKPSFDDVRRMVQALLADRFKLATRTETRELQVFALVVARSDGKLGPHMRRADVDCDALREARRAGAAPPAAPPSPGAPPPPCSTGMRFGPVSRIESGGMTTAQLVSMLSQAVGRPVVDRSDLKGDFVLTLEFSAEAGGTTPFGPPPPGPAPAAPVDTPSLFAAIQEQLGLKLDARREPTEVLVIDRAEQPTPD